MEPDAWYCSLNIANNKLNILTGYSTVPSTGIQEDRILQVHMAGGKWSAFESDSNEEPQILLWSNLWVLLSSRSYVCHFVGQPLASDPSWRRQEFSSWSWVLNPPENTLRMCPAQRDEWTYIEVITNSHHGSITTSSLTFHLNDREFTVFGGLARLDTTELFTCGVENVSRSTKHAGSRRANLNEVLSDRFPLNYTWIWELKVQGIKYAPVEHGIKRRNLVYTHGWHTQQIGDIIHDADTRPPFVLPLAKIEEGNDSRFLVLRWIMGDDFLRTLQVFGIELESNLEIDE